jgi:hypothetical protein
MVEVFKTNVTDQCLANRLLDHIHKTFPDYKANFDMQDCDKILRVTSTTGFIQSASIIYLLKGFGCIAEVLPDNPPPPDHTKEWKRILNSFYNSKVALQ